MRLRQVSRRLAELPTRKLSAPKIADPFYLTPQYRTWQAEVIRRSGGRCQGQAHDAARPRSGVRLFADHVAEIKDGGARLDPANGQALCGSCHTRKTAAARAARRTDRGGGSV